MRRHKKRRGQVVVFYALMIPIFLFAGGVGLDLGWYYLNVSRLQHAADASVIVGARVLAMDTTNFKDYVYKSLVDKYPGHKPDPDNRDTTAGDHAAAMYALKNLSSDTIYVQNGKSYMMEDNYTRGDPTIILKPSLYKDINNNYYYVVHLSEDIHHFFLGFLDDMYAGVVAVAKLNYVPLPRPQGTGAEIVVPEGTNILAEMYKIEDVSVIRNWEWQDWYGKTDYVKYTVTNPGGKKELEGTTTATKPIDDYKAMTGKDIYTKNWGAFENVAEEQHVRYSAGDHYRYETITVKPDSGDRVKNNKNKIYSEEEVDSINLDMNPDLQYVFTEDWDIGYPTPKNKSLLSIQHSRSSKADSEDKKTFELRIHATFNFDTPYKKRDSSKYDTENNPEDVLYVRIESEPIEQLPFIKNRSGEFNVFSSVRQIILNINQSNMDSQYRPLMFFYSGPEKITKDENDPKFHIRDSQPLILNLRTGVHKG